MTPAPKPWMILEMTNNGKLCVISLNPQNTLPIINTDIPNNTTNLILILFTSSPTIGVINTTAIKYTVKINATSVSILKSFCIVGVAKDTIDVSIALINIISTKANTIPLFLVIIHALSYTIFPLTIVNLA